LHVVEEELALRHTATLIYGKVDGNVCGFEGVHPSWISREPQPASPAGPRVTL
jgi:hypothetical protein